jgi:hypothetical protein
MIAVLVRDHDAVDGSRIHIQRIQPPGQLRPAEPHIHQDARILGLDQKRVAPATTS